MNCQWMENSVYTRTQTHTHTHTHTKHTASKRYIIGIYTHTHTHIHTPSIPPTVSVCTKESCKLSGSCEQNMAEVGRERGLSEIKKVALVQEPNGRSFAHCVAVVVAKS